MGGAPPLTGPLDPPLVRPFRKFNVAGKRKLVEKGGGVLNAWKRPQFISTNDRFPFRGVGGLRKIVTSFLFLAMLNLLNYP